jgi:histidyl-tRNA synthetase
MAKPSLPQGTRDFGPEVVRKRNYILNTIRNVFELYGFQPLETPAMENIETLMGKYGEEGDKLIFRILDSGNSFQQEFFKGLFKYVLDFRSQIVHANPNIFHFESFEFLENLINHPTVITSLSKQLQEDKDLNKRYLSKFKNEVSSKALRYDLTIPFARYVAMNHGQLTFPFKRYQIQPVWRADRPQKGRYREFYQCDADVVGSVDLITELELLKIYDTVFERLNLPEVEIRINSRTVLKALAACINDQDRFLDVTTTIDKLDKIGIEKVKEELLIKGFNKNQIIFIEKYLNVTGNTELEKINNLFSLFQETGVVVNPDAYAITVGRLRSLIEFSSFSFTKLKVDFTLARGLNYYTGLIVEVKCNAVKIGSIGGGGTYHNLTELFGIPNLPGVGISFGVDRIYDAVEELGLFPKELDINTQVLFFNLGRDESNNTTVGLNEVLKCVELAEELRKQNIRCEIYPKSGVKFDKQFKYAEKKGIPFVVIIGEEEIKTGSYKLKNIVTGEQKDLTKEELLDFSFKHSE